MKIRLTFLLSICALFTLLANDVFACACCAERGHYSIRTSKPAQLQMDELKKLRFSTTELYMTEAGEDEIKGISPIGDSYTINGLFNNNSWKFDFKDNNNKTGMLNLTMPTQMLEYNVDIHDGEDGGAGSPLLYKEWRFKYNVKNGTGIFQNGIKGKTEYFLVLQGRGNLCTSAENFTHYNLEVTGKNASYKFFGTLTAE